MKEFIALKTQKSNFHDSELGEQPEALNAPGERSDDSYDDENEGNDDLSFCPSSELYSDEDFLFERPVETY